jgi:hypothetical protein
MPEDEHAGIGRVGCHRHGLGAQYRTRHRARSREGGAAVTVLTRADGRREAVAAEIESLGGRRWRSRRTSPNPKMRSAS